MLTVDQLKAMPPDTIFATGTVEDPRLYRGPIRWVAVRGGYHDWTIYYHHDTYDSKYIKRHGDKCITDAVIRALVPCEDEAFKMYRF